jgi:hypothetical protein
MHQPSNSHRQLHSAPLTHVTLSGGLRNAACLAIICPVRRQLFAASSLGVQMAGHPSRGGTRSRRSCRVSATQGVGAAPWHAM